MESSGTFVLIVKDKKILKKTGGIHMKKTAAVIITLILVMTLGSTTAFAVGRDRLRQNCQTGSFAGTGASCQPYYTDENNDGICDHYEDRIKEAGTAQHHRYGGNSSSGFTGTGSAGHHHAENGCGNRAGCRY